MTKGNIKEFFKTIRAYNFVKVKELIESNSEYLTVCSSAPPKKDDGQSPLQVAFKIGAFDIAEYLINKGANVNFIEESEINVWRAPVLHDCIRATLNQTNTKQKDLGEFERVFSLLKLMLEKGADPNALDSYGNSCLLRAFLDTRQMIDHPAFNEKMKTVEQSRRVFRELIRAGANVNYSDERRENIQHLITFYMMEKYKLLDFDNLPEKFDKVNYMI
jgi:hypothetical protein